MKCSLFCFAFPFLTAVMLMPSADASLIRDTVSGDKHERDDRELASPTSSVASLLPTSLYGKIEAIHLSLGSKGEGSKGKVGKSKGGKGGKSKGGKGGKSKGPTPLPTPTPTPLPTLPPTPTPTPRPTMAPTRAPKMAPKMAPKSKSKRM